MTLLYKDDEFYNIVITHLRFANNLDNFIDYIKLSFKYYEFLKDNSVNNEYFKYFCLCFPEFLNDSKYVPEDLIIETLNRNVITYSYLYKPSKRITKEFLRISNGSSSNIPFITSEALIKSIDNLMLLTDTGKFRIGCKVFTRDFECLFPNTTTYTYDDFDDIVYYTDIPITNHLTYRLLLELVKYSNILSKIPKCLKTKQLCLNAISYSACCINDVPNEIKDIDFYIKAYNINRKIIYFIYDDDIVDLLSKIEIFSICKRDLKRKDDIINIINNNYYLFNKIKEFFNLDINNYDI